MEANKNENTKQAPNVPRDMLAIEAMLKEMGVTEYEPGVVNSLLDFAYRKLALLCLLQVDDQVFI